MMSGLISWQDFRSIPGQFTASRKKKGLNPESPAPSRDQVGTKLGLEPGEIMKVLNLCKSAPKLTDLMEAFSWSDRTKFRKKYLNPLIGEGLLEMTIPDKPQSSLQRYRLTAKGKEWLEGQR
jgi:ATP-dependent DNA helicase RecG